METLTMAAQKTVAMETVATINRSIDRAFCRVPW
jgi:hypothetical protein